KDGTWLLVQYDGSAHLIAYTSTNSGATWTQVADLGANGGAAYCWLDDDIQLVVAANFTCQSTNRFASVTRYATPQALGYLFSGEPPLTRSPGGRFMGFHIDNAAGPIAIWSDDGITWHTTSFGNPPPATSYLGTAWNAG